MKKTMTVWGVGPLLGIFTVLYAALALVFHLMWPADILIFPQWLCWVSASVFLLLGVYFWITPARIITRAFDEERLLTTGIYAYTRNPLYTGIFFVTISGSLSLCSYWLLTVPVWYYLLFRFLIRREETYMLELFGTKYQEYMSRVHALIPLPKKIGELNKIGSCIN